jgi:cobalt-zinc-cadmium efflux system outer membrane protein
LVYLSPDARGASALVGVVTDAAPERDRLIARVGAFVTVPLLNRREGPIGEAQAQLERARLALAQARFDARASFDAAWAAYRAAGTQVQALEGGILERARSALAIAEAAYRLGERGILEYLDAQRQFRFVRNELIAARVDRQKARAEIARLTGS